MTLTPEDRARFAAWCRDEARDLDAEAGRLSNTAAPSLVLDTIQRRAEALRTVAKRLEEMEVTDG